MRYPWQPHRCREDIRVKLKGAVGKHSRAKSSGSQPIPCPCEQGQGPLDNYSLLTTKKLVIEWVAYSHSATLYKAQRNGLSTKYSRPLPGSRLLIKGPFSSVIVLKIVYN